MLLKRILVAALIGLVAGRLAMSQTPSEEKTINSLAVLPFLNVADDRNTEHLADEITKELINGLSKLPNLKVVRYTSVLRYRGLEQIEPGLESKDKALKLRTIRNELGVQAVLYGRVVQRGEGLSISAELVDADDSLIWDDQYNRKLSDVLAVQEEMVHDISKKLRPRLTIDRKVNRKARKQGEGFIRLIHKSYSERDGQRDFRHPLKVRTT
jgi:TolB-like protein